MDRKDQGSNPALILLAEKLLKTLTSHIGIMTPSKMAGVQWPVQGYTGEVITLDLSRWMEFRGAISALRCLDQKRAVHKPGALGS